MVSPKEWGPNAWELLHGIAERVGNHTNLKLIKDEQNELNLALRHFWALLPCMKCQNHYREWIRQNPPMISLYGGYLQDTLRKWVYDLHEAVNQKNEVVSGIPLETIQGMYAKIDLRASATRLKSVYQRGVQSGVFKPTEWKVAWKHLDYLLRFIGV